MIWLWIYCLNGKNIFKIKYTSAKWLKNKKIIFLIYLIFCKRNIRKTTCEKVNLITRINLLGILMRIMWSWMTDERIEFTMLISYLQDKGKDVDVLGN